MQSFVCTKLVFLWIVVEDAGVRFLYVIPAGTSVPFRSCDKKNGRVEAALLRGHAKSFKVAIYKTRKPSISVLRSILDLFLGFLLRHAGVFLDLLGLFFIFTGDKRKGHACDHYDQEDR